MARKKRRNRYDYTTDVNRDVKAGLPSTMTAGKPTRPVKVEAPLMDPPPGSYDPALDAQLGQTNRGLGDLLVDLDRDRERDTTDLLNARNQIGLTRQRGNDDFATRIANLDLSYQRVASNQRQAARQRGVTSAGLAQVSAQRRAANQARDRSQVDLAKGRFNEDLDRDLGELDVRFGRREEDRTTGLTRAQREAGQFSFDIADQKRYQSGFYDENSFEDIPGLVDARKRARKRRPKPVASINPPARY